jgi:predicted N-formylglutamate amidohydrolase
MTLNGSILQTLLSDVDPPPFAITNEAACHPVLLTCEHAGGAIPSSLPQLGLDLDSFRSIMDFAPQGDNFAGALSRQLAAKIGATLIESVYHRFVVDVNRGRHEEFWFRSAEQIEFPVNQNLTAEQVEQRVNEIWEPFDQGFQALLHKQIAEHAQPVVLSIHTYHKSLRRNQEVFTDRPWAIGVLWDEPNGSEKTAFQNRQLGQSCAAHFETYNLIVGRNQPYDISGPNPSTGSDWETTLHRHVSRLNTRSLMLEIRNDQLSTDKQLEDWVERVAMMIPLLTVKF